MATKTTAQKTETRETIELTEDDVIAAVAAHYGLPIKGPTQFDVEVDISSSGFLRGIKFTRNVTTEPKVEVSEI